MYFICTSRLKKLIEVYVGQVGSHTGANEHFAVVSIEVVVVLANPD